ncbi:MAG: hypothetical protein VX278_11445, partial [Myxococcota bacterium]|nr:hypothetical protein [Myxococcota bacterium]
MFLFTFLFALVYANPPSDTEKRKIEILQELIPQEAARKITAEAKGKEIESLLSGSGSLFLAFPHYESMPLLSKT